MKLLEVEVGACAPVPYSWRRHCSFSVIFENVIISPQIIQSNPEKKCTEFMHHYLATFAVKSCGFHQNDQERFLSTNQCKNCIS